MELHARVEGTSLAVRGRVVDEIGHTTQEYRPDSEHEHNDIFYGVQFAKWLSQVLRLVQDLQPSSLSNDEKDEKEKEMFWRTLICNKTHNGIAATPDYADYFDALTIRQRIAEEALESCSNEELLIIDDPSGAYERADRQSRNYRMALQNSMYTKSFCLTKELGMMGMVPGAAQVGDSIVVVAGSRVPFVMRRVSDGGQGTRWILIQECYVHGVMSGEYAQDAGIEWEEIIII
jgi:hypothetical protein